MQRRHPLLVGEARRHVAQVDQQGAVGGLHVVPGPVRAEHLQTGDLVGPEDGDDAVVGVLAHAHQFAVESDVGALGQGVVVHPQHVDRVVGDAGEVAAGQTQGVLEDLRHHPGDPARVLVVGGHQRLKARHGIGPEVLTVGVSRQVETGVAGESVADVEGFEEVVHPAGRFDAQRQAEGLGLGRRVAAVDARRRAIASLEIEVLAEEGVHRAGEAIRDGRRHAVPDDLDEADLAAGPVNLGGDPCPLGSTPAPHIRRNVHGRHPKPHRNSRLAPWNSRPAP